MDKLPQEHIVPEPRKVEDLKEGEGAWVAYVHVDHGGTVFLQRSAEVFSDESEVWGLGERRRIYVERIPEGWLVRIPEERLPLKPKHRSLLEMVSDVAAEVQIV